MSTQQSQPICKTLLGEGIAKKFRQEITDALTNGTVKRAKLVGLLATTSAPSRAYAEWTSKACEAIGIEYELREIKPDEGDESAGQGQVEEAILEANADDEVNGIMVYYPIFGSRQGGRGHEMHSE